MDVLTSCYHISSENLVTVVHRRVPRAKLRPFSCLPFSSTNNSSCWQYRISECRFRRLQATNQLINISADLYCRFLPSWTCSSMQIVLHVHMLDKYRYSAEIMSKNKTVTVYAASCHGTFTLGEITVDTSWRQAWSGSRAGLNDMQRTKHRLSPAGIAHRVVCHAALA